ncbi:MAG: GxxExxY protein [Chitinophagaceae bacterium]
MKKLHNDLLLKEECYQIIGLCMKVHRKFKRGYQEVLYKDALEIEFKRHNIPYEREKRYPVFYDGIELRRKFVADFVVFGLIILEVKAMATLSYEAMAQTLNYVNVAGLQLGLLIAFGAPSLLFKRIISSGEI